MAELHPSQPVSPETHQARPAFSPFYRLELEPALTIFADTAELRASGAIRQSFSVGISAENGASLAASLDTLQLRLYPTDRLTVDLGLLRHIPGAAIMLSPVNYLAPVSLDLATGGNCRPRRARHHSSASPRSSDKAISPHTWYRRRRSRRFRR